jgi:hypothetical protein
MRKFGGSVTIFLALTLTSLMALTGGLFETVRAAGQNTYVQTALDSSLESLMSGYHREVFDRYRIFVLENASADRLSGEIEPYLDAYFGETGFYPIADRKLTVSKPVMITAEDGKYFDDEAVAYMRVGILPEIADSAALLSSASDTDSAESLGEVTADLTVSGRGVLRLEKAMDRILESLAEQKSRMDEGDAALFACDGGRFRQKTGELKRELSRMPELAAAYDKAAEKLGEELDEAEQKASGEREHLSAAGRKAADEQIAAYRSYTEKNGPRREEIRRYEAEAAADLVTADRALARADEVEEILASRDEEDDDDGGSSGEGGDDEEDDEEDEEGEASLWRSVLEVTAAYHRGTPKRSGRDRKKLDLLETLSGLREDAVLALCVPEGVTVSRGMVNPGSFPSARFSAGSGRARSSPPEGGAGDFLSRLLFDEYGLRFFDSFLAASEEKSFRYEAEYLLFGRSGDRENLTMTVMSLFGIRAASNLLSLLADEGKKGEARAAAEAVAGTAGPFSAVVYSLILTVWASLEAVRDVRILLNGGKIPAAGSAGEGNLCLSAILERGLGALDDSGTSGGGESGMDYPGYLRIFLLLTDRRTLRYRMMDMIQENVSQKEPGFSMENCAFRVEAVFSCRGVLVPLKKRAVREYR